MNFALQTDLVPKFHVALRTSFSVKPNFNINTALPTVISKLFPFIHSRIPPQFPSSAYNKVHIQTLYLFHFLKLYPPPEFPLPEGRPGTAWEHLYLEHFLPLPSSNVVLLCLSIIVSSPLQASKDYSV
jgi:hypothetical protein